MIGFNVGRRGKQLKDTARNISGTREYVVNIADETLMDKLHQTSGEYPSGVSELEELGLTTVPSEYIKTPGIAEAPVQMECVLSQVMEFGRNSQFFVGEVKRFRIRDGLCVDNKIETAKLRPLARVGGPTYARLHSFVTLQPAHKAVREEV
jgi:flavin reductase (DIM6/NTAB) family NADH-FMN oxidoreductase RutF